MIAAVLGPTASGKSALAMKLAEESGGTILSVDSMQVYRSMDIGTAKASPDDQRRVPHRLIDLAEPEEHFTVAQFQHVGRQVLEQLGGEGTPAIIVGGSGLHFRSLVDPLDFPPTDEAVRADLEALDVGEARERLERVDPDAADFVDMANPRRVIRALEIHELTDTTPSSRAQSAMASTFASYQDGRDFIAIGVDPGEALAGRVEHRVDQMIAAGLLAEVERVGPRMGRTARQAVGYKEMFDVVAGRKDIAQGRNEVVRATMALAKRQRTFFRRDHRIGWLQWSDDADRLAADAVGALQAA